MKKLCQVSGKHTVGGIVFYKHLFLVFYCVNRNLREKTKWCVFHEKTWINNDIYFSMPLVIVGDFVLQLILLATMFANE